MSKIKISTFYRSQMLLVTEVPFGVKNSYQSLNDIFTISCITHQQFYTSDGIYFLQHEIIIPNDNSKLSRVILFHSFNSFSFFFFCVNFLYKIMYLLKFLIYLIKKKNYSSSLSSSSSSSFSSSRSRILVFVASCLLHNLFSSFFILGINSTELT